MTDKQSRHDELFHTLVENKEYHELEHMEKLLENSFVTTTLFNAMIRNPDATYHDLKNLETQSNPKSSEFSEALIQTLLSRRDTIYQTIHDKEYDTLSKPERNTRLFQRIAMVDDPSKFKLESELDIDESYPLAVIYKFRRHDDFLKTLDTGLYSGEKGYYRRGDSESPLSVIKELTSGKKSFPFIAIDGIDIESHELRNTLLEEMGHAENNVFRATLHRINKSEMWSKTDAQNLLVFESKELGVKLSHKWIENNEQIKETPEWQDVVQFICSIAKDELIAALRKKSDRITKTNELVFSSGYSFITLLGLEEDSDLYKELNREYRKKLFEIDEKVGDLLRTYRSFGLNNRINSFKWVLAQLPLETWISKLTEFGFFSESQQLDIISRYCFDKEVSDEDKQIRLTIYNKLRIELIKHEDKPFSETLDVYQKMMI